MMKLMAAVSAVGLSLLLCAVALAWNSPTPGGITCDAATFTKVTHESTPWTYNVYVNGSLVKSGPVSDSAGAITVPLAGLVPGEGVTSHVKVTVNGPGGYTDGGATVEADVTCGETPVVPPGVNTPAPSTNSPAPAPPVTKAPPAVRPKPKAKPRPHPRRAPHSCKYGKRRYSKSGERLRDSRGHKIAICNSAPKLVVRNPKFTG